MIENLPIELKSFYLWEKVRDFQIIDPWMEDFAYKTDISWWIYVLGGVLSIFIALVSISVKVWKASGANPIDSLKYE